MSARRSHDRDTPAIGRARALVRTRCCAWLLAAAWAVPAQSDIALDDEISLGNWSPARTLYRRDVAVCISTDDAGASTGARFRLIAQGETAGAFALTNAIDDRIPYTLSWTRSINANAAESLASGVPTRNSYRFRNPNACRNGNGAGLRIVIELSDIDAAPPGRYDDLLQLTVVIE